MLKAILSLLGTIALIFLKFFRKKERASEVLSETPVIDSVKREADAKAVAKFTKLTTSTKE